MKDHEDEIIRVGDLVEAIADSSLGVVKAGMRGLVKEIDALPTHDGCSGPFISVEGIHPSMATNGEVVTGTRYSLFRKIHPDAFKKADKSWDWNKTPVSV